MMESNVLNYFNEDIASCCYYGNELINTLFNGEYQVYQRDANYALSQKKIEGLKKIAWIRNYYLRNPISMIRDFFNIELLDFQTYMIMGAWNCPNVILLCSRGAGKSTFSDLLIMTKQMLVQDWVYIASGSGDQAQQTFTTLERIANDQIDSMVGSTGVIFKNEVEIKNAAGDGFSHSSDGFTYSLYNGSFTKTLNSNVDRRRGHRSNMVLFDECGWLDSNLLEVYKAFTIVDKNFRTGTVDGKVLDQARLKALPIELPNQLIYISSASDTESEFYAMYRDFSKRMLLGDNRYFVAHIDCELTMHPTIHGRPSAPLLTSDKVESALRNNPEKARREYFCEFTSDAGDGAIIRRGAITRNEQTYKPILYNDTGDKKFVICYDPARSRDNSVILVMEIYKDKDINGDVEYKGRVVNCINLIDVGKKRKSPMQTPDQVEYLKELILDYNQGGDENYSNIVGVYIDAGSGGGGVNIADYLMEDWIGKDGKQHKGLIDKEYSADYVKKFPGAVDKIHLISPTKYKSDMYEAMIEMVNQNKITFTTSYDNKGYLTVFDIDEEKLAQEKEKIAKKLKAKKLSVDEYENQMSEELSKLQNVKTKNIKLDWAEEAALAGIDALKEEIVNTIRIKRSSGKDSFELTPEKRNSLNDDRCYTMALASYCLTEERRKNITSKRKTSPDSIQDFVSSLPIKRATRNGFNLKNRTLM